MIANDITKIGNVFKNEENFLIFPHVKADGDAFGSAKALTESLRLLGKNAHIVIEDDISANLLFLIGDDVIHIEKDEIPFRDYVSVCVDCGDIDRFPRRKDIFLKGKTQICIDHHSTSKPIWDYNLIDENACATGQLIYEVIEKSNMPLNKKIAESIFTAITTDTGNFQYSNTNRQAHSIVLKLYDYMNAEDMNKVSIEIYERVSVNALKLQGEILSKLKLFKDGKGVISYVTNDMVASCGANMNDSEGMVAKLRSIDGIEISGLLKENQDGSIKVSLRSKGQIDVAKISANLGGGGHKKAAGFTLETSMEEALKIVENEMKMAIENEK